MKRMFILWLLLSTSTVAYGQGEYFVHHGTEARALSKELQANAHFSPKRFDDAQDVSDLPAWLIGTYQTATDEFHLVAYYSTTQAAYVGLFHGDKQLHAMWAFPYDARQFYSEGTKLMFAARAMLKADTSESWARVPREVVVDFSALPTSRTFSFRNVDYAVLE